MPVKRRLDKRRPDDAKAYPVWAAIFDCGRDFFDELPEIGVACDKYGKPDRDAAQAAWERFGARWLAEHPHDEPQWAEREFGRPWDAAN
ncbi:hypothetical protein [Sphingopyxis witflariensis]|uniref:Uncharacterized protein n=1 Tax=Sphingopyxis witflariensis TaxID=173675 RepID=A0A246K4G3_9SPHN|nr:hypothetical protein [Sphingopyxis witflariensis]OWR00876.1 hypothetical protein CDQ91_00030 [Sphingopyxis witflariensis]